jgi:hypothetical protein
MGGAHDVIQHDRASKCTGHITGVKFPLNLLLSQVLICYSRSQISELRHIFETSVTYLYVMILPCILVTERATYT